MTGDTYPRILKPGCQGCLSPHDWRHDEDCPGRSEAAGHRHAKDFFGKSLYLGDEVAALVKYRSGSSSRRAELVLGTIVEILPKRLRVRCEVPYGRPAQMLRLVTLTPDAHVVKAPR